MGYGDRVKKLGEMGDCARVPLADSAVMQLSRRGIVHHSSGWVDFPMSPAGIVGDEPPIPTSSATTAHYPLPTAHSMLHPLEIKLAEAWPPSHWADVTVLVAVSGGGDSVALLRAMAALKTGGEGRLCAAHLNHQLRPDADDDERFVVDLCGRLGVTCEVGRVDVGSPGGPVGDGIEAAARSARYRFLEEAAGRLGARFVATAHTADDQAETILHRILRGTGIRGLGGHGAGTAAGPRHADPALAGHPPRGVAAYLDALGQPYRHDPSNARPAFHAESDPPPNCCRGCSGIQPGRGRSAAAAGHAGRRGPGRGRRLVDQLFDRCVTFDRCVAIDRSPRRQTSRS